MLCLAIGVAVGEWMGWPFLAGPLQNWLVDRLDRRVAIVGSDFSVRFAGGLRLKAAQLEIGAPRWSQSPHLLTAKDVALELRYADLWRAYRGERLRVHALRASSLDGFLERRADGAASWQFGSAPAPVPASAEAPIPFFGTLQVASGILRYTDVPLSANMTANLSLGDGVSRDAGQEPSGASSKRLRVNAVGRYRDLPVKIELKSSGALPWEAEGASDGVPAVPVAMTISANIGRAEFSFNGAAQDALHLGGLTGIFSLKGPSLAAVGDPFGVTLPSTAAFRAGGRVARQGDVWQVVVDDATVGASRLNGAFSYEAGLPVPKLSGRLRGSRLLLTDLGPAVGIEPDAAGRSEERV